MIDAHIHLFDGGYPIHPLVAAMRLDELKVYEAWRREAGVTAALVVGWEGEPWAAGNNNHIARLATAHSWILPTAFVSDPAALSVADLERLAAQGFVGVSIYSLDESARAALARTDERVWAWLAERRWFVSANSKGEGWLVWGRVLEKCPDLSLLVSHLGLPPAVESDPDAAAATDALASVTALAKYPNVCVKLSGFYALTRPAHDYPHAAAWPYVKALVDAFGTQRLLWGSDFSPCLQALSLPQTYTLFESMPFFSNAERQGILGGNMERCIRRMRG